MRHVRNPKAFLVSLGWDRSIQTRLYHALAVEDLMAVVDEWPRVMRDGFGCIGETTEGLDRTVCAVEPCGRPGNAHEESSLAIDQWGGRIHALYCLHLLFDTW